MLGQTALNTDSDDQARAEKNARLQLTKDRFEVARSYDRREDEAMHEDALMLAGGENQWVEAAVRERKLSGRPMYTGNRFPAMLAQITGEIRKNRPGIVCRPADSDATSAAAEVFEGLIRSIERLSQARQVYARVGKSIAAVGKGHARIVPVYADDESFDVELRIRAIPNVHAVKWDPASKQDDKSDANWCLVTSEVDKKAFEEAYPQIGAAGWAKATTAQRKIDGWRSGEANKVTVCEHWEVKRTPFERYRISHPEFSDTHMLDADGDGMIDGYPADEVLRMLTHEGFDIVQSRTAYKKSICMRLYGGEEEIAGPIYWMGQRIPIFTACGEITDCGDETIVHGIIRHAKDAQRLFNYARSADMELVSQAPKAPILIADKQIEGYEDEWVLSTRQPTPYLRYRQVPGLPAPSERSGPSTNPGPAKLAQDGIVDMQDVIGIHDASLGKRSNETSGVAIAERDAQADTGTFVYLDNLNLMIEAIGNELVNAIPKYYSTRRQIMILGRDDEPAIIELSQIDLALGKYHVICQTGPSFQSKREKAAQLFVEMSRAAPPWAQPIIFKRIAKLSDLPDAQEFIEELDQVGAMIGALPPPQSMPAPSGVPGAPPSNVTPFPQPGGPAPDPLAGIRASPPRVPAARPRVGDGPRPAAPPGM